MAGAPSEERVGGEPWTRLRAAVPGRWDVPVLRHVSERVTRPSDLLRAINAESSEGTPLSRGVLFAVLHRMIVNGLLTSSPVPGAVPPATHYSLTPAGEAILDQVVRLGSRGARWWTLTDDSGEEVAPPGVDVTVPTPARVWNYWQGGKDNFQADREQGDRAAVGMPMLPVTARMARIWQADVVRRLAERGVRQFLDIGTGLPSAGSVHEVAQAIAPESRVVYVDNDPIVLAHARALLASAPEGACAYLDADVRDPAQTWPAPPRSST